MFGPKVTLGKFETKVGFCLPNAPAVSGPTVDVKKFENEITIPNTEIAGYKSVDSMNFDGVNELAVSAIKNDYAYTDQMTVSCWAKMNSLQSSERAFVRKNNEFQLGKISDTRCRFLLRTAGGGWTVANDFDFTFVVGEWFHALLTYDSNNLFMYMNGQLLNNPSNVSGNITKQNSGVAIGARGDQALQFNGNVDEVRLWDRYLTPDEVDAEYNNGCPADPTYPVDLLSHWPIESSIGDDGTGTTGVLQDVIGGVDAIPVNTEASDLEAEAPC